MSRHRRVKPVVLWRHHLKFVAPLEAKFASDYAGAMASLREAVRNSGTTPFNLKEWQAKVSTAMRPTYRAVIANGGKQFLTGTASLRQKIAVGGLTKAARRRSVGIVRTLEESFTDRIEETVATTWGALQDVLTEAVEDGLSKDEIEDLIDEEWDDILGRRTDSIALTETNGAVNSVRDYLMHELVELQSWINAEDERVRLTHVIYAEAGPKPVGFDWAQLADDAGYTLRFPCDPLCHDPREVVNCRCFVLPAGEVELSPEELKDYLSDFEMDPEDVMLSEDQEPVYVVNRYTGKGISKGEREYVRDDDGKFAETPGGGDAEGGGRAGPTLNDVGRAIQGAPPGFNYDPSKFVALKFPPTLNTPEKLDARIAQEEAKFAKGVVFSGGNDDEGNPLPKLTITMTVEEMGDNMEELFQAATPAEHAKKDWYVTDAGAFVTEMHDFYKDKIPGLALDQVAGLTAACSANAAWDEGFGSSKQKGTSNQVVVQTILETWTANKRIEITPEGLELAKAYLLKSGRTDKEGVRHSRWSDLGMPKAGTITFQDLAKRDARLAYLFATPWTKDGNESGKGEGGFGWGGMDGHVVPSLEILGGKPPADAFGDKGKVRSFHSNIVGALIGVPTKNATFDIWMARAMLKMPRLNSSYYGSFTSSIPRYEMYRRELEKRGKPHGLDPDQYQAVVWSVIRNRNEAEDAAVAARKAADKAAGVKVAAANGAKGKPRKSRVKKGFDPEADDSEMFDDVSEEDQLGLLWLSRAIAHLGGADVDSDPVFGPWDADDQYALDSYMRVSKGFTFQLVTKGDFEGHPFRGNQWTDVFGNTITDDNPRDAQTDSPDEEGYASDPDDPSVHPGKPGRIKDNEFAAREKKVEIRKERIEETMRAEADVERQAIYAKLGEAKKRGDVEAQAANDRLTEVNSSISAMKIAVMAEAASDRIEWAQLEGRVAAINHGLEPSDPAVVARFAALNDKYGGVMSTIENSAVATDKDIAEDFDAALARATYGLSPQILRDMADKPEESMMMIAPPVGVNERGARSAWTRTDAPGGLGEKPRDPSVVSAFASTLRAQAGKLEADLAFRATREEEHELRNAEARLTLSEQHASTLAGTKALAEQGVDFVFEKCMRDDRFYAQIHAQTAEEWKNVGGEGPMTLRFAAKEAFGIDGIAFDVKLKREVTDLNEDYPGAMDRAIVQAGALRREYIETQQEIADGFTFHVSGGDQDIDYDAVSQMQSDEWHGLSLSDKADYISQGNSEHNKVIDWASDHDGAVEDLAREEDPYSEPKALDYASWAEVKAVADDAVVAESVVDAEKFYLGGKSAGAETTGDTSAKDVIDRMERLAERPFRYNSAVQIDSLLLRYGSSSLPDKDEYGNDMSPERRTYDLTTSVSLIESDAEYALDAAARIRAADPRLSWITPSDETRSRFDYSEAELRSALEKYRAIPTEDFQAKMTGLKEVLFQGKMLTEINAKWSIAVRGDLAAVALNEGSMLARSDDFQTAIDEWKAPYIMQAYAAEDPDGNVFQNFAAHWEPDPPPMVKGSDVDLNPDDWPLQLHRTLTIGAAALKSVKDVVPNFAESWSYDLQGGFGKDRLTASVEPARVLVFQHAKNWSTPKGEESMGSRENEFIILSEVPKFVREARERHEKVREGQLKVRESRARKAKIDALVARFEDLKRMRSRPLGRHAAVGHKEAWESRQWAIEREAEALGLDWDSLVARSKE